MNVKVNKEYEIIVLGAGPAGYVGAIRAGKKCKELGIKDGVACIGKQLGGTCLQEGCIPSKFLLHTSHQYDWIKNSAADFGIKASAEYDLSQIIDRKEKLIKGLSGGISGLFKKSDVTHYDTHAKIIDSKKKLVQLDSGEVLQAKKAIIIATGSKIIEIPFKKDDGVEIDNSRTALTWRDAPKDLLVVGAGYIGLELASVWKGFGANVKVVDLAEKFLPFLDDDVSSYTLKSLKEQGLDVYMGVSIDYISKHNGRLKVKLTNGEEFICDKVLSAVGRKAANPVWPADIKMDGQFVKIDEHYRTSVNGIYAIGDIVGGALLAHKASDEAWCAVEHIFHKQGNSLPQVGHVPSVIYLHPEVATIGENENSLKEKKIEFDSVKMPLSANSRAMNMGETKGFVKILFDKKDKKVLGAAIVGIGAEPMICQIAVGMSYEMSVNDLACVCYPHPSVDEALREAFFAGSVWGAAHG